MMAPHPKFSGLLLSVALCFGVRPCPADEPLRVVFDTDMGNDVDDALALAMLHSLESRGELKLLAVTLTKDNRFAAPYIDIVNTYYGRPHIPIGVVKNGKTPEDGAMIRTPVERKNAAGGPLYPHDLADGRQAPDAVPVLRKTLASEVDGAVTLIQVGFSTNLARLLDSAPDAVSPLPGRELIARKVRLLSVMAGKFTGPMAEFNVHIDVASARKLFSEWPTPLVASGFEIGEALLFPAVSIERDFRYAEAHPVVDAYRAYKKMPYDRPTWDLTAVLYAARPERDYFALSGPGTIEVAENAHTTFRAHPEGRHRYLILREDQKGRTLEALIQLASQPPSR